MTYIPPSIIAAMGGGGGSPYPGFAPPSSPSAYDDEFDGTLSAWTTWDENPIFTGSTPQIVSNRGLQLRAQGIGAGRVAGIYRSAPSGTDFSVHALISMGNFEQNFSGCGVFVGEDLAGSPTTAGIDGAAAAISNSGGPSYRGQLVSWNTFASFASETLTGPGAGAPARKWVRLRYNSAGNSFSADVSDDGLTWLCVDEGTSTSIADPPATIGVMLQSNTSPRDLLAYARHFRVTLVNDFYAPLPSADFE